MIIISQLISYIITGLVSTSLYIKPYAWYYRILLGAILSSLCLLFGNTLDQFITPIFLVIGIILTLITTKERIWNIILFQLGWFWFVISDYLITIPMWIIGYPISAIQTTELLSFIYVMLHSLLSLIPITFLSQHLRKSFYSRLIEIPFKAQVLLFIDVSICCFIYIFNIIYGSFHNYEDGTIFFNGLLFTFYLSSNLFIFYFLYRIMYENKQLALESKSKEELLSYTKNLEALYENMRVFRHDYINILSTMKYYIDDANLTSLKKYFYGKILPVSSTLTSQNILIGKLSYIKILELKSIFYTKIIKAIQSDLYITLELTEDINEVSMDTLKLCTIVGILLDNAIEAAATSKEKKLHIAIVTTNYTLLIHIENSTVPILVPVENLLQEGYTSKGNDHSGIGLYQVNRIIAELPNVLISTTYDNSTFVQELEIETKV